MKKKNEWYIAKHIINDAPAYIAQCDNYIKAGIGRDTRYCGSFTRNKESVRRTVQALNERR